MPDNTPPTQRFSSRVEFYVRSRPKYPAELLHFLRKELALKPTDEIADVGSGTGILTELLLGNGNIVHAIEPNPEMRQAAEATLSRHTNFRSHNATAEAIGLPPRSVALITAGQAFHWFEPAATRREFARILAPGGHVALIWNERRLTSSAFAEEYQRFLERFSIDHDTLHTKTVAIDPRPIGQFFAPAAHVVVEFDNAQVLDFLGLLDRVVSSSYMPLPGHPTYEEMANALRALFDRHASPDAVRIDYDTRMYYGGLET